MFDTSFSSKLLLIIHALLSTASRPTFAKIQKKKKREFKNSNNTCRCDKIEACSFFDRCPIGESKGSRAERKKKKKRNADSRLLPAAAKMLWSGGGRRRKEGGLDGARTLSKALSLAAVSAARRTVRSERAELALGSAWFLPALL